jgi:AraC-like DNA-binding protein
MLTQDNIYVILFSLPIYQLLFYTVQLITLRKSSPSKRYLGLMMLSMTAFLVMNAMYHLGYEELFAKLYYMFIPVLLCIGPVYFLYILSLTREDHDVSRRQKLILFSPVLLMFAINIFAFGLLPGESKLLFISQGFISGPSDAPGLKLAELAFGFGAFILLPGQIIMAGIKIRKILLTETAVMRLRPAYLAYLNWSWVMGVTASVVVFLIVNALIDVIAPTGSLPVAFIYNILMLIAGGIAGFYGMKQNSLLVQVSKVTVSEPEIASDEPELVEEQPAEKLPVDFIQPEEIQEIIRDLTRLMEEQKPYLNVNFSMGDLCSMLNQSRRKVTYVINDVMDKNFYGIVNDYRVKESLEMLSREKSNNLKMEVISEMVGFQSKSSFYACFKKYTGQTPTEYKASLALRRGREMKS